MSDTPNSGVRHRETILGNMVEINLVDPKEGFLIIKETLTRCGIANVEQKKLYQSCHIFHKKGKFYIVHFKEMLAMDGLPVTITSIDITRRNLIINMLIKWNMIMVVDPSRIIVDSLTDNMSIFVLPFSAKPEWTLIPKYTIGKK